MLITMVQIPGWKCDEVWGGWKCDEVKVKQWNL